MFTGPDGNDIPLNGIAGGGDTFVINFDIFTTPGQYTLTSNARITDLAGNLIDQNQDGTGGEVGVDEPVDTFVLVADATGPVVIDFEPIGLVNHNVSSSQVMFSEQISASSFGPDDVVITTPSGVIESIEISVNQVDPSTFEIGFPSQKTDGDYTVTIGPEILDLAGNKLGELAAGPAAFTADFTIDQTGPSVVAITPTGTINEKLSSIEVAFSESINPASFAVDDITLMPPSGALISAVTIAPTNDATAFQVSFPDQALSGTYTVLIGPQVLDPAGNPMDQDGDGTHGESEGDVFEGAFQLDLPPFSDLTVSSLITETNLGLTGRPLDVTWTIRNDGLLPATGTWAQRVFVSGDDQIGDDVLAGQYTFTGTLPIGQSYSRAVPVQLPTKTGNYWIILQIDATEAVDELFETNNTAISATPIQVQSAYAATVSTEVDMAPADTPVLLTGSAVRAGGGPAPFEQVSVHLTVRGTKRVLPAITDAEGNFEVTFNPLPGEGGNYTVGAAHPGEDDAPVQDTFQLVGMRAESPSTAIRVMEGGSEDGQVTVRNLADIALTGLSVEVVGLADNLHVTASLTDKATELAEMGTVDLDFTLEANDASQRSGEITLRITSNEAPTVDIPVRFNVVPLVARLVADTERLAMSMLVGNQTSVELTVTNAGGVNTGPLSVLLPTGAPWLTLATPAQIESLAPGQSTSLTLLLTPSADLDLTTYDGNLVIEGPTTHVSVPFSFRAVSESNGDLEITVVDEYFFFTEEKPLVTGATVTLRDPFTGDEEIASSDAATMGPLSSAGALLNVAALDSGPTVTIDPNGRVRFSGVPEGPYTLEVGSEDHETYNNTVRIEAGELNAEQVFISRNLVEYIWTVEEVEIEDRTRITVESVFEANVPAPVVTIEGQLDLADLTVVGQTQQFDFKITNHGLIEANDVALEFGTHPFYEITPLVDSIGTLPAKSELVVPVIVKRVADFHTLDTEPQVTFQGLAADHAGLNSTMAAYSVTGSDSQAAAVAATSVGCTISARLVWTYVCGELVTRSSAIAVSNVDGDCGGSSSPISTSGRGTNGDREGHSGPGGVIPIFVETIPETCECSRSDFTLVGVDATDPTNTLVTYQVTPNDGRLLIAKFIVNGTALTTRFDVTGEFTFSFDQNILAHGSNTIAVEATPECLPTQIYKEFVATRIHRSTSDTDIAAGTIFLPIGARQRIGFTLDIRTEFDKVSYDAPVADGSKLIWVKESYAGIKVAKAPTTWSGIASWGVDVYYMDNDGRHDSGVPIDVDIITSGVFHEILRKSVTEEWFEPNNGLRAIADTNQLSLPSVLSGGNLFVSPFPPVVGSALWSVEVGIDGGASLIAASMAQYDQDGALGNTVGDPNAHERIVRGMNHVLATQNEPRSVCGHVRLNISQDAILVRKAFDATLQIVNSTSGELTNIAADIVVADSNGQDVANFFGIQPPKLDNLSSADGNGILAANSTGSLSWLIVPTADAAPLIATEYFVSGAISYTENELDIIVPLVDVAITVHPQAELDLQYFHQRDVIGDDPFTDEIEPAEPFTLAVMVQNNGAGEAQNLRIGSAQPKIIENEKGLLIDFEIIGTQVNGGDVERSLTAEFGNLEPGGIGFAQWQLESTLQGLFIDYQASFEHISPVRRQPAIASQERQHPRVDPPGQRQPDRRRWPARFPGQRRGRPAGPTRYALPLRR